MKIWKKKGKNQFFGVADDFTPKDGWVEPTALYKKSIMQALADTWDEGNIPTRWELITPDEDWYTEDQDEYGCEFLIMDLLASRVKCGMQNKKMTVYQLSQKSGVSQYQIHRFLKAEGDLTLDSYVRIISALGMYPEIYRTW